MSERSYADVLAREYAVYRAEVEFATEAKHHVLLAHLYMEHLIERLIATRLSSTKALLGQDGLTFQKKAVLAAALGMLEPPQLARVLKLNAMRNKCVHRFKHKPTQSEIEEFQALMGNKFRAVRLKSSNATNLLQVLCAHLAGEILRDVVQAEEGGEREA